MNNTPSTSSLSSIAPFKSFSAARINRSQFWLSCIAIWCVFWLLRTAGFDSADVASVGWIGWVITLLVAIAFITLCRNRLHDVGKSSSWLLMVFIPIVGAVWLVGQLGFKQGQSDSNRWGPSTLITTDFLKVA